MDLAGKWEASRISVVEAEFGRTWYIGPLEERLNFMVA